MGIITYKIVTEPQ